MTESGVYQIRNTVNGKLYVGSAAKGFTPRWTKHRSDLRNGSHHSPKLQRAWNKYGEESFVFEVIVRCAPEECIREEQRVLDETRSYDKHRGYNICRVAGSFLGMKLPEEAKAKISKALTGRKVSEETRRRQSEVKKNCSPETRRKLSEAAKGHTWSEETRAKVVAQRNTPESRAANRERAIKQFSDPAARRAASEKQKEVQSRPEIIANKKAKAAERFSDPAERKKMSEYAKRQAALPGEKERKSAVARDLFKRLWADPEWREKLRETRKSQWADPERKAAALEKRRLTREKNAKAKLAGPKVEVIDVT